MIVGYSKPNFMPKIILISGIERWRLVSMLSLCSASRGLLVTTLEDGALITGLSQEEPRSQIRSTDIQYKKETPPLIISALPHTEEVLIHTNDNTVPLLFCLDSELVVSRNRRCPEPKSRSPDKYTCTR